MPVASMITQQNRHCPLVSSHYLHLLLCLQWLIKIAWRGAELVVVSAKAWAALFHSNLLRVFLPISWWVILFHDGYSFIYGGGGIQHGPVIHDSAYFTHLQFPVLAERKGSWPLLPDRIGRPPIGQWPTTSIR